MLTIEIEEVELYDSKEEVFITLTGGRFRFEHSLAAIAEWESKWKIPYFTATFTPEQEVDYYTMMCLDDNLQPYHLTSEVTSKITEYINDSHTATTFTNSGEAPGRTVLTNELVYAMMAAAQVPFECEHWNFNRLLTLLRVIADQQAPKKKMSTTEIMQQNAKLNAERKKQMKTKG